MHLNSEENVLDDFEDDIEHPGHNAYRYKDED